MSRRLILYEDRQWRALRPLTDLLPVPALAFGASDLARRWLRAAGAPLLAIEARAAALACWHAPPPPDPGAVDPGDEVLAINAAALPGGWLPAALGQRAPALYVGEGRVAGARLPLARIRAGLGRGEDFETVLLGAGLPAVPVAAEFLTHAWELIERNPAALAADLADTPAGVRGEVHRLACLEAPERIAIEPGARVGPFAVLDARPGPIRLAGGAQVAAHTVVTGPCALGAGTQLLGGAVSACTFGPECRIAGEVEASVWQGYANKRHHGFVGHSAVGEWVNLGALTTTSDLKNNYGSVRVWVDGRERDSGVRKLGAIVGAHVKTGIGTLLPTGASVGTGANLFGGGRFAPRAAPAFAWWDGARAGEHELERFLATARTAMARRGRALAPGEEAACRALVAATADERRAAATA